MRKLLNARATDRQTVKWRQGDREREKYRDQRERQTDRDSKLMTYVFKDIILLSKKQKQLWNWSMKIDPLTGVIIPATPMGCFITRNLLPAAGVGMISPYTRLDSSPNHSKKSRL